MIIKTKLCTWYKYRDHESWTLFKYLKMFKQLLYKLLYDYL